MPLHHLVDHELTFQSTLARGEGLKKKLNVTLVSGRTQDDPRATIRFFRTHQGSFGNLVSRLLELRNPKNKKVIIHSDRSSSNLVEKHLEEAFEIDYAGVRGPCKARLLALPRSGSRLLLLYFTRLRAACRARAGDS